MGRSEESFAFRAYSPLHSSNCWLLMHSTNLGHDDIRHDNEAQSLCIWMTKPLFGIDNFAFIQLFQLAHRRVRESCGWNSPTKKTTIIIPYGSNTEVPLFSAGPIHNKWKITRQGWRGKTRKSAEAMLLYYSLQLNAVVMNLNGKECGEVYGSDDKKMFFQCQCDTSWRCLSNITKTQFGMCKVCDQIHGNCIAFYSPSEEKDWQQNSPLPIRRHKNTNNKHNNHNTISIRWLCPGTAPNFRYRRIIKWSTSMWPSSSSS